MIMPPVGQTGLEALSPELILVSPPDVAAAARLSLPDREFSSSAPITRPSSSRTSSSLRRATGLVALYVASLVVTITPFALAAMSVPSGKPHAAHHAKR